MVGLEFVLVDLFKWQNLDALYSCMYESAMAIGFFSQLFPLIKTTNAPLIPREIRTGFEVVLSELCETGGKLLQHCIMCLPQWVQYVSRSALIVVSVRRQQQQPYRTACRGDTVPTIGWREPHETLLMRYNIVLQRKEMENRRQHCSKHRLTL